MNDLSQNRQPASALIISGVLVLFATLIYWLPPELFVDKKSYHAFAGDQYKYLQVPHALNVLTNLPFLWVGLWGIFTLRKAGLLVRRSGSLYVYFLGVLLTAVGSAYYHSDPQNGALVWDRLPMTVAFSGLLAATVEYRISARWGKAGLPVLLLFGLFSVWYWYITNYDDLRPYIIVQYGSLVIYPVIIWRYPKQGIALRPMVIGFFLYMLAKVFETYDLSIYQSLGFVGGHPLKHLAASWATYCVGVFLLRDASSPAAKQPT